MSLLLRALQGNDTAQESIRFLVALADRLVQESPEIQADVTALEPALRSALIAQCPSSSAALVVLLQLTAETIEEFRSVGGLSTVMDRVLTEHEPIPWEVLLPREDSGRKAAG